MTYFPNATYNRSKVATFDGAADYLSISAANIKVVSGSTNIGGDDASELNPTKDESFTCSAWTYLRSTSGGKGGVNKCNLSQTENGWLMAWSGNTIMQIAAKNGYSSQYRRTLYTPSNQAMWRHCVWVYDHTIAGGSGNTFQSASFLNYQNGMDFTQAYGGTSAQGEFQTLGTDAGSFNIGRAVFGGVFYGEGYFNGNMSEVSYWDAALTKAQIAELFNGGSPTDLKLHSAASNLKGWWLGGDGTVTFADSVYTVQDSSGSGFHLTSAGMADGAIVNTKRIGA